MAAPGPAERATVAAAIARVPGDVGHAAAAARVRLTVARRRGLRSANRGGAAPCGRRVRPTQRALAGRRCARGGDAAPSRLLHAVATEAPSVGRAWARSSRGSP
jgi:hypothetical protein